MRIGWVVAIIGVGVLFGASAVLPYVSKAQIRSKPTVQGIREAKAAERDRQMNYVKPILDAIQRNDLPGVERGWHEYVAAGKIEDPRLRLITAKFFVRRGEAAAAHDQLERILHPPPGNWSSLQGSGEVMTLWLQTGKSLPKGVKDKALREWEGQLDVQGPKDSLYAELPAEAKAEWLAAQELETLGRYKEALAHYGRAAALASNSPFALQQYGLALHRAGQFDESKRMMVRSYLAANPDDRDALRKQNGLSPRDIASIHPKP